MTNNVYFKKSFQKVFVQLHRDRSQYPNEIAATYDGKHPFFNLVEVNRNEESFKTNLKNPLCSVFQNTLTIVIEENGPKICAKIFEKNFSRSVGKPYFKLEKNMRFVSVNVETGNIYFGELTNYQKKRKFTKKVRVNSFINDSFRIFKTHLKNSLSNYNVEESAEITIHVINLFIDKIDGGNLNLSSGNRLFKFYLDKKKIKYPNNFPLYSNVLHGEFRKILKKYDNKIVDTFMELNKIQGKKVKKVLHTVDNLNISNYTSGLNLFGQDWLNQDETLLREIFNNKVDFPLTQNVASEFNRIATPKEKKKAFLLYKTFNKNNEIDGWTLRDHFIFFVELKRYGAQVEWKSFSDSKFFRDEHLDWTDKLTFYRRGHYSRIYPDTFFKTLKNFQYQDSNYFPIVLTNTKEYNEESSTQSNCVRGYIGSPSSLIISLRRGTQESDDRLTIEFKIHLSKNSEQIFLDRIQTRSKYNSTPDFSWNEPLKILDEMVQKSKFQKYKLRKKCQNGVELESDTEFNENGHLVWTYKSIENDNNYFTIF